MIEIDTESLWAKKKKQKRAGIQVKFENKEFGNGHKHFKKGWFHKGKPLEQ